MFCFVFISQIPIKANDTIDVLSDLRLIEQAFPEDLYQPDSPLLFMNQQSQDVATMMDYGLHFRNQVTTYVPNALLLREESDTNCTNFGACEEPQWYDSPIVGVHGEGTHVVYQGAMKVDNARADLHLLLTEAGRFTLDSIAYVDLVFSRWGNFTRSIYAYGDGSGVFEIASGFVADRSQLGTAPVGMGAIRLYDVVFRTHDEQGLPHYYRPKRTDTHAKINSHLVVMDGGVNSSWQVVSRAQDYPGGLWLYDDFMIETEQTLSISGQIDTFQYAERYVNYGGLMFFEPGKTLTKHGQSSLVLSGDQAYEQGSKIKVKEGALVLETDPYMYENTHFVDFKNFQTGQHLSVSLIDSASLQVNAWRAHLQTFQMAGEKTGLHLAYGSQLRADSAYLQGALVLHVPDSLMLTVGNEIEVIQFGQTVGSFNQVQDDKLRYLWDTSALYEEGLLKVSGIRSEVRSQQVDNEIHQAYPNPSSGEIHIPLPKYAISLEVYDLKGELYAVFDLSDYTENYYKVDRMASGNYAYRVRSSDKMISQGKFIVAQ